MFDIDYIKRQYCKYKCNAKTTKICVIVTDSIYCDTCQEYTEGSFENEDVILEDEACKLCQIDKFIRELEDFKMLKS